MPTEKEMKLKDCPFCGGRPIIAIYAEDGQTRYSDKYAVRCTYTGLDKGCGAEGQHNKYKEEAIEAWNRRSSQSVNKTSADFKQGSPHLVPKNTPFCPECGKWGHTSGGCPAIVKNALNSISLSAEAVEKIREALESTLSPLKSIGYYGSDESENLRNTDNAIANVKEALSTLPSSVTK